MRGFQLWINLPAKEKMKPAGYRDIRPEEIPVVALPDRGQAKVIAGTLEQDGKSTSGPINNEEAGISTDPLYLDVTLPANGGFAHSVPEHYNAFVYVYEGGASVGAEESAQQLPERGAGLLTQGDRIEITAGAGGARFILLAARPLNEPIVQYGPFVMNTREEIEQAVADYRDGVLTQVSVAQ